MNFVINGGKKLSGEIAVSGAKNGAFPLIAAALLIGQDTTLHNIPDIRDIHNTIELLQALGADINYRNHTLTMRSSQLSSDELDREISKRMRASILFTAPLLARRGKVSFPHPGGCVIGERPIDLFLAGYQAMGASTQTTDSVHHMGIPHRPKSIHFTFPAISTTATYCLMMLATLADGTTKLSNAACEPEVTMLADFLNTAGAKISGAGTPWITIEGIEKYPPNTLEYTNIPDRVETGSFLFMAMATKSTITVSHTEPDHQEAVLDVLRRMGANCVIGKDSITVIPPEHIKPIDIKTHEYPGFATDLQSPFIVALTQADGSGLVQETIFEGRMFWLEDLQRMGAQVMILDTNRARIEGPAELKGRAVKSPDLRAGMAYIIAGLTAEGTTTIHDVEIIDRGYERIEERLQLLGAHIKRVTP